MKYEEFLTNKTSYGIAEGIKQTYENPMLFDFQREILSRIFVNKIYDIVITWILKNNP